MEILGCMNNAAELKLGSSKLSRLRMFVLSCWVFHLLFSQQLCRCMIVSWELKLLACLSLQVAIMQRQLLMCCWLWTISDSFSVPHSLELSSWVCHCSTKMLRWKHACNHLVESSQFSLDVSCGNVAASSVFLHMMRSLVWRWQVPEARTAAWNLQKLCLQMDFCCRDN